MYGMLIKKLNKNRSLDEDEYVKLIDIPERERHCLLDTARKIVKDNFGKGIYMRGLIEFSNYCGNDCYYCGIRKSNAALKRYRLTKEEILDCCRTGNALGFRTFVLQGGEDPCFTSGRIEDIIGSIKAEFPENAITLSLGESDYKSYKAWFDAGADRYLLKHETANCEHYSKLHPKNMLFARRINCLNMLQEIGYQTGTGFMVESPYQVVADLAKDLKFIEKFKPAMVGIGPFMSHRHTKFKNFKNGSAEKTLTLISILRLMNPKLLIPSTTALNSALRDGRERGILAGANVVMPNITPEQSRKLYSLYDNKAVTGAETVEGINLLANKLNAIGYELLTERGDY